MSGASENGRRLVSIDWAKAANIATAVCAVVALLVGISNAIGDHRVDQNKVDRIAQEQVEAAAQQGETSKALQAIREDVASLKTSREEQREWTRRFDAKLDAVLLELRK